EQQSNSKQRASKRSGGGGSDIVDSLALISRRCHARHRPPTPPAVRANCGAQISLPCLFSLLALVLPVLARHLRSPNLLLSSLPRLFDSVARLSLCRLYRRFPAEYSSHLFGGVAAVALFCFVLARLVRPHRQAAHHGLSGAASARSKAGGSRDSAFVEAQRKELYTAAYLKQSVKDSDF
uniref:Rhomboid domain-containing protein n=1 Tax=Macrostomum lignano TaxID=282301 RepID=A0A1I8F812_9PLAT